MKINNITLLLLIMQLCSLYGMEHGKHLSIEHKSKKIGGYYFNKHALSEMIEGKISPEDVSWVIEHGDHHHFTLNRHLHVSTQKKIGIIIKEHKKYEEETGLTKKAVVAVYINFNQNTLNSWLAWRDKKNMLDSIVEGTVFKVIKAGAFVTLANGIKGSVCRSTFGKGKELPKVGETRLFRIIRAINDSKVAHNLELSTNLDPTKEDGKPKTAKAPITLIEDFDDLEIVYTYHARDRMRERGITEKMVTSIIQNGQPHDDPRNSDTIIYRKDNKKGLLQLSAVTMQGNHENQLVVITSYYNNIPQKSRRRNKK